MNDKFFVALDNILYLLDTTLKELDLTTDELFAYAKKYNFNRDELESFIKEKSKMPKNNQQENKKQPTYEEYLEILKAKRASSTSGGGANYADSMVFYKGKALGRCPAGTTRSGKTCVPSAAPPSKGPGYKQTDLGGLSQAQVKALSKARSTKDIIEAHKKSNKK
jgi:hypothetical protein